jgi:transposase InsO family protein
VKHRPFRCESILLKSHWLMVAMDQYTRRIIGFAVRAGNVDGPALCRMFYDATSSQGWPKYISSYNDPLFQYHRWEKHCHGLFHLHYSGVNCELPWTGDQGAIYPTG